jgi:hypothetical protein
VAVVARLARGGWFFVLLVVWVHCGLYVPSAPTDRLHCTVTIIMETGSSGPCAASGCSCLFTVVNACPFTIWRVSGTYLMPVPTGGLFLIQVVGRRTCRFPVSVRARTKSFPHHHRSIPTSPLPRMCRLSPQRTSSCKHTLSRCALVTHYGQEYISNFTCKFTWNCCLA